MIIHHNHITASKDPPLSAISPWFHAEKLDPCTQIWVFYWFCTHAKWVLQVFWPDVYLLIGKYLKLVISGHEITVTRNGYGNILAGSSDILVCPWFREPDLSGSFILFPVSMCRDIPAPFNFFTYPMLKGFESTCNSIDCFSIIMIKHMQRKVITWKW